MGRGAGTWEVPHASTIGLILGGRIQIPALPFSAVIMGKSLSFQTSICLCI